MGKEILNVPSPLLPAVPSSNEAVSYGL